MAEEIGDSAGFGEHIQFEVKRFYAYVPISTEMALDSGLITEDQARAQGWQPTTPRSIPWWRRLRWRWQSMREKAGRRIGGWIAGIDISQGWDE
jgi:hypothetical protein